MAPKQRSAYFLSDDTIEKLNGLIKTQGVDSVCEMLDTSPKSLRSWLCKGQSISTRHRETVKKHFGDRSVVEEHY